MLTNKLRILPKRRLMKLSTLLLVMIIVHVFLWKKFLVDSSGSDRILCIELIGGLGNMMFQYASAFAIAADKNMTLIVGDQKTSADFRDVFDISAEFTKTKCGRLTETYANESASSGFDEVSLNFNGDTSRHFKGYRQSWKYFLNRDESIRNELSIKRHILSECRDNMTDILEDYKNRTRYDNVTTVALHVRRGDIMSEYFQKFGYRIPESDYIKRAMEFFRRKYKEKVLFIVCSNDAVYVKEYLQFPDVFHVETGKRAHDLAILSMCDHTIMTTGSFGWWAGWLAGGTVIYYKYPFHNGTQLGKMYTNDMKDYYKPEWISMS